MTQFYVKDGGSFREVSEFFIRDGTSFTNKTVTNIFVKDSGNWREVFTLFTATSYSSTTGSVTVPALAMPYIYKELLGAVQVDIVVQTMIKLAVNLLDQVVHLVRIYQMLL